ncbi:MAG: dTDP-4-dehydrorhamnose reductase [Clostridia bacterium]|nr:dTDP-4-dehydrorhamnose reductase [Clostridia bacterium]
MERVLVTGANGQLGYDVVLRLRALGYDVYAADMPEMDVTSSDAVRSVFDEFRPEAVIHCAAYTAVDKAESEPVACARINVDGTRNVAEAAQRAGAKMIYISTDYVYAGSGCCPMCEDAPKAPCNVYGRTKFDGEQAAKACSRLFIVRTSWVFGRHGGNFVKTMLRLAEGRDTLQVVCDQIGSPTFTEDLAALLCEMLRTEKYGVYNASNDGFCSWHTFAETIFQLAGKKVCVQPVKSCDYACAAVRPLNSRLSKQSLIVAGFSVLPHWKDALARFLHSEI